MTYREKSQNNNPDLVKSMICLGKSHIFLTRIQKKEKLNCIEYNRYCKDFRMDFTRKKQW